MAAALCGIEQLNKNLYDSQRDVYNSHLYNAIMRSDLKTLKYILVYLDVAIPSKTLMWCAKCKNVKESVINVILEKMLNAFSTIKKIVKEVREHYPANISSERELEGILSKFNLYCTAYQKQFLLELLTSDTARFEFVVNPEKEQYPFFLHDAVFEAAYYANSGFIESVFSYLSTRKISYIFQPSAVRQHEDLFKWLTTNISKAEEGEPVGWRSGPCSQPWPSTTPQDYLDTYALLCSVSFMER